MPARMVRPADVDDVVREYLAGSSLHRLSRERGVSRGVLVRWLTEAGVELRGHSAAARRKREAYDGVPDGCPLTARQLAVLRRLAAGKNRACVAAEMGVSHHAVWDHVSRAMGRLDATSALQAIVMAREAGWLDVRRPPVDGDVALTDAQREYARAFTVLLRTSPTARQRLVDGIVEKGGGNGGN